MTDIVERLRGYRAAAYPAHGSGFVGLFTGEGSALMLDAATAIETLTREKAAAESYVRIVTDYLRKVYPSDQDGADSPFGAVGYMVRERERAEAAEKLFADLTTAIEFAHSQRFLWPVDPFADKHDKGEK